MEKESYGSAYLYSEDLLTEGKFRKVDVTIEAIHEAGTLTKAGGGKIDKPAISFVGAKKMLVLCKCNQSLMKYATGEFRSAESIHYGILLPLFAPTNEIVNTDTGQVLTEKISSSEMTTSQFMDYVAYVQQWAAEFLGVDIPNPNEEILLNLD